MGGHLNLDGGTQNLDGGTLILDGGSRASYNLSIDSSVRVGLWVWVEFWVRINTKKLIKISVK